MAPLAISEALSSALAKRVYCSNYDYNNGFCERSSWSYWGRWVFAAVVVVLFIILFVTWGCINSRRRRRAGIRPMYGTGWMAPPPKYPGGPGPGPGVNPNYAPPPAYAPPPQQPSYTGTSFNSSEGFYGHHEGIQMGPQAPANAYYPPVNGRRGTGGQEDYEPPAGPPPGKH